MTDQVRLSGDASNDAGLDDSIAFSRYTEAIDRISHQYSLWEEAQNEFRSQNLGGVDTIKADLLRN